MGREANTRPVCTSAVQNLSRDRFERPVIDTLNYASGREAAATDIYIYISGDRFARGRIGVERIGRREIPSPIREKVALVKIANRKSESDRFARREGVSCRDRL